MYGAGLKHGASGGFKGLLNAFLGKSSVVGQSVTASSIGTSSLASGLLAAGGGVLIGLTAAKVIAGAIDSAYQKTYESNKDQAEQQLEGTALSGNDAATSAMQNAISASDSNNGFFNKLGAAWSSTINGVGGVWNKHLGNLSSLNQTEFKEFRNKLIMKNR